MNALDLLIDFYTLLSTSVEPTPHEDENVNTCINSSHDPGMSSLTSVHPLPFEPCHSTQQASKENLTRHDFPANLPFQRIFSPRANYSSDYKMIHNESHSVSLSSSHHNNHTPQTSIRRPQVNPCLDLHPDLISITPQTWNQQPEFSSQWALHYEPSCTSSSVPETWYDTQIPDVSESMQYQNARFKPISQEAPHYHIPCNDDISQCWNHGSLEYHSAETAWPTGSAAQLPFDCSFPPKYNEWTLTDTTSTNSNVD